MLNKALCYLCLITICVNLVSCADDQPLWHSYQLGTGNGNREELTITEVTSDNDFNSVDNVLRWKSVSIGSLIYAAGLMPQAFYYIIANNISNKKKFEIKFGKAVEMDTPPLALELFTHWDEEILQQEVVLAVAVNNPSPKILFFRFKKRKIERLWAWHVSHTVSHLHYFKLEDNKHRLLILQHDDVSEAVLYEFKLGHAYRRHFWVTQVITLSVPTSSSAVNTYGSDAYLSFPQKDINKVQIYKLTNDRFELYQTISSESVSQVNSFKIGFKSFLAIGGGEAGIYRFTKKGLVWEEIDGLNLENVDFWFPIPVKTYRDEVILILQRSLHHETHKSYFLEVVLYDGRKFVPYEEISCSFFGEVEHGLACMVDEEIDYGGLLGAAVLTMKKTVGILVPRNGTSALFMVRTKMKMLKSPVDIEVEKLNETRTKLQEMIDEQQSRIKVIQDRLQYSVKVNEPNTVTAPWKVDTLSAPIVQQNLEMPVPAENLKVEEIDLQELKDELAKIRSGIDNAKHNLLNAVWLNKAEHRFDELIIDGEVQVPRESKFKSVIVEKFNDEPVSEVFNDVVRKQNINLISSHKTFTDLEVENLNFEVLNGVDVRNRVINTGTPITLSNDVVFDSPVKVIGEVISKGQVNDRNLSNEVVQMNKKYEEPLQFEQVEANAAQANNFPNMINVKISRGDVSLVDIDELEIDELQFPGNVTVENVNGENFDEFLKSICFTNIKTHIPGDTVLAGVLNLEGNADIAALNGLKFPEEYVLGNSKFSEITGKKMFEGTIFANEITTQGKFNGINTKDIVTLTKNQSLAGSYIFNDLEITESLNVEGEITGPYIDNFLTNPVLTETADVKAKVNFKHLEVQGIVIVSNNFNEVDFGEILNDVLYEDEEEATISSIKNFVAGFTVNNGMNIDSNAINTIPINLFVTKNTEQTILFQTLNGAVSFENLLLEGLYGDVDITKLEQETVKLTGEQFVSSTLILTNHNEDVIDLSATDLSIVTTLNNLTARDYFFTTGDSRSLSNVLDFDDLHAQNLFVEGEVSGNLLGFSLKNFDERRLSYTRDQVVTAKYNIKNFECDNFYADFINGESFGKFFKFQYYADKIAEMLFDGKLKIKNLHVNGSVFAENINGQDMKNVLKNWMWTDRNNNFDTAVFQKNVIINNLHLKNFNDVDFKLFTENIIFKAETNPIINSFKLFTNGFHVTRMLNSERLNDVHVDDILTKTGAQEVTGPLNIHGNVLINSDCEIRENLNDISVEYLTKTYQFVGDTCIINDDLVMNRLAYIEKLEVDGHANGENLEDLLPNIVYKSENTKIFGKITFENSVQVDQNMIVTDSFNNVDFSEFVDQMVFITKDELIEGTAMFTQPVYIGEELIVDSDINTRYLRGIDLESWDKRAVFINRGEIPGNLKFESVTIQGNIFINYLNDINLNALVPLRTDQYINQTLKFYEVIPFNDVSVVNLVNGYKLQDEYVKTLYDTGDIQTIAQGMTFYGHLRVGKNIEIEGHANGKNLSKLVTTNTNQNLTATYNFTGNVNLNSDLTVSGPISGINPLDWQNRSVRSYAKYPQNIDDSWRVDGNTTFKEGVEGKGLIGGIDVRQLAVDVQEKHLVKKELEMGMVKTYSNMCQDLNVMIEKAQNQIYMFKYLENLQKDLEFENNIEYVHHFEHKNKNYLLITEAESCMSFLFIWSKSQFQLIRQIETGSISQFISVYDGDLLFLVSRHDNIVLNCSIQGTNVWKFESDDLMQLYQIEDQKFLQESLVPGTFYGLSENFVVEFKIVTVVETNVKRYRKWQIDAENLAFVPRGLATGLALSNGQKIFRLIREDPVIEEDFGYATDVYIRGKVIEQVNTLIPGRVGNEFLVMNVGIEGNRRTLVAVASHEETSVKGRLDFIKIYEDVFAGKIFHKVPSYKPSSLVSLEFGENGETLLLFLEDGKTLQVYEYKGIEGFKHRTSAKLEGSKLVSFFLQMKPHEMEKSVVGVINKNRISLIQAVMVGNQIDMKKQLCVL